MSAPLRAHRVYAAMQQKDRMKTFKTMIRAATRLTRSGQLMDATRVIQKLMASPAAPMAAGKARARAEPSPIAVPDVPSELSRSTAILADRIARFGETEGVADVSIVSDKPERGFVEGSHVHEGLTRRFKLFTPASAGRSPALVVMLHGCTQSADDFAAGTRMNEWAEREGFVVLYPIQSRSANPGLCWNWFNDRDQYRGSGEAAFLADLIASVVDSKGLDPRRVFVAGLSAGGAMAAILASEYPERFAAIGIHSGLAAGAAHNLPDALSAMRSGRLHTRAPVANRSNGAAADRPDKIVPTIVFHGDDDQTVHPANASAIVADLVKRSAATIEPVKTDPAPGAGQRYTRQVHAMPDGGTIAEHWTLHGAPHAWSGGDARGSYTHPAGVDATAEFIRFFNEQAR